MPDQVIMIAVNFITLNIFCIFVNIEDTQLQIPQQTRQQHQQQATTTGQSMQHQQQTQNIAQQFMGQSIPRGTILPQNYVSQIGQVTKLSLLYYQKKRSLNLNGFLEIEAGCCFFIYFTFTFYFYFLFFKWVLLVFRFRLLHRFLCCIQFLVLFFLVHIES